MKRIAATMVAVASLMSLGTARAEETVPGTIMLPDFGTPSIGRVLYGEAGINGLIGYVFRVNSRTTFTLTATGGATGLESFDIFFYDDAGGKPGTILTAHNTCPGGQSACNKSGPVPGNARWAVVTLVLGANGAFRYVAA